MTGTPTERDALRIVCEQLAERFPTVEVRVVELTVEEESVQLTGPIRDFVPVLTQKLAATGSPCWSPASGERTW